MFLSILILLRRGARSNPDCTLPPSPMGRTGAWARSSLASSSLSTDQITRQHKWSVPIDALPTSSAYPTRTSLVVSSRLLRGSKTKHTFARCTSPSPSHHQSETTHGFNSTRTRFTSLATSYLSLSPTPLHRHRKIGPGILPVC